MQQYRHKAWISGLGGGVMSITRVFIPPLPQIHPWCASQHVSLQCFSPSLLFHLCTSPLLRHCFASLSTYGGVNRWLRWYEPLHGFGLSCEPYRGHVPIPHHSSWVVNPYVFGSPLCDKLHSCMSTGLLLAASGACIHDAWTNLETDACNMSLCLC